MNKFNSHIILLISILFVACKKDNLKNLDINSHTLPIFEINIKEKHLWSPDSGLYVVGTNGIEGCRDFIANYHQAWEHPANIKFYENGELKFDHNVGFRIKGFCSRSMGMKSLGFYWRNEYGNSDLRYPMFKDSPISKYNRMTLRNSGQDFGITHLKDGTITDIFKYKSKVEFAEYRPAVVYLNGEYWGIQNIREMITPWHFQNHYGVNRNTVDLIGGSDLDPEVDDGSRDDWMRDVIGFVQNNDLSLPENYNTILNRIDIESFIDNMIIQTYIGKLDWPAWNAKWWRNKTYTNYMKWKWVIYDLDLSMLVIHQKKVWIGDLYKNHEREHRQDGFYLFNNLIKNKTFVEAFLKRYIYFIDEVFEPNRVKEIVLNNKKRIQSEYPNHSKKWSTGTIAEWEREVQRMIKYNNERNYHLRKIILSLMEEHAIAL